MPSWEDVLAVLATPLEDLVDAGNHVPFSDAVDDWDLPVADRRSLLRWGLPRRRAPRADPQLEPFPTLAPNVAGEVERRFISPEQRLYRLGHWDLIEETGPTVGAVAGDGRVLGIKPAPWTTADLSPSLRTYYPDLHIPSVSFINSSVSQFVECSWRWHSAEVILEAAMEDGLTELNARRDDRTAYRAYAEAVRTCSRDFLRGLSELDPGISAAEPQSLWVQLILED